ncbi:MAG: VCBS repeat-containing protein [Saprospiraceae bacterium]|nr:VCBS repeat-containing protein [Saprospiraceae bacterium]
MDHKRRFILLTFLLFNGFYLISQPSFENKSRLYKKDIPTRSVIPGATLDIDGDLIDDLVILDNGIWLKTVLSSGKNFGLKLVDSIKLGQNSEITLSAGDINNDGVNEIITSGEYSLINVSTFKDNKTTKKSFQSGIYAQGSCTADINNDGWLDYFLANDDGPNRIYINDKSGNLILTSVIDFLKNDSTDGSGNYGSVWTDVNGDLLPDLCISKCRVGVDNPKDLRRVNRLYLNRGNGIFEEKGAEYGLNSGDQSWVTVFGDIDNDGDQDAYVVNHGTPHILLENIDGKFFKQIPMPQPIQSYGFQAIMSDLDNDGLLDIVIAGIEGATILHNRGDKHFDILKKAIGPNLARSLTIGDLNDDGFPDIYAHINEPLNDPGLKDDELWINKGNSNHYIKISLEGKISNRSAIGTLLTLYSPGVNQVRYVKGGESYGVFNSLQQIFGLGSSDIIDSLVIRWPSGVTDIYTGMKADRTYFAQEGKCMSEQVLLYPEELIIKETSISLRAPDGSSVYVWNSGVTSNQLIISKPGKYFVKMTDNQGCVTVSKPISVISGCFVAGKKLITDGSSIKICSGDLVEISASKAAAYQWSNGKTTQSVFADKSGMIQLVASDYCGNQMSDSILVEVVSIEWNVKGDTIKKGESALLISDKKTTAWYSSDDAVIPFFTGDTLKTASLDSTIKFYARNTAIIDFKEKKVGEKNFPLIDFYGANSTAGGLVFNVESACKVHSVLVNTDTKGMRRFLITDKDGRVLFSKDVNLADGMNRVIFDFSLKPGVQYKMLTDENINISSLGYKSPRLVRTFNNTSYPYDIENVLTVASSTFGAIYYYYFYDWEVQYDFVECSSELREVTAFVEASSNVPDEDVMKSISIYPNPVNDQIIINTPYFSGPFIITISDMQGKTMFISDSGTKQINVDMLAKGIYILTVHTSKGRKPFRLIKI